MVTMKVDPSWLSMNTSNAAMVFFVSGSVTVVGFTWEGRGGPAASPILDRYPTPPKIGQWLGG